MCIVENLENVGKHKERKQMLFINPVVKVRYYNILVYFLLLVLMLKQMMAGGDDTDVFL